MTGALALTLTDFKSNPNLHLTHREELKLILAAMNQRERLDRDPIRSLR